MRKQRSRWESLLSPPDWEDENQNKRRGGGGGGGRGIFHIPPVLRFHGDRFHNTVTLEGARSDTHAFSDKVAAAQKEIKKERKKSREMRRDVGVGGGYGIKEQQGGKKKKKKKKREGRVSRGR